MIIYSRQKFREENPDDPGSGDNPTPAPDKKEKKKTTADKVTADAVRDKEFAALKVKVEAYEKRDADNTEFKSLKSDFEKLVAKFGKPVETPKNSFWDGFNIFE